jgi:trk system potassium uptake protein TrkA
VELAQSINRQGHPVSIVDANPRSFDRLTADFHGRTVLGDALDAEALRRAGIETAHGLAAVTSSDSANVVVARVARDLYHIHHVVARVYDPLRAPIYEMLGIQTVATAVWGAQRIEQLLLHPGLQSVYGAGSGEVQLYEVSLPDDWHGRPLSELLPPAEALPVAVTRGGRGVLPAADFVLQSQDLLQVSATAAGAAALRERLHLLGKD